MESNGARILIVDDEPHICELLSRWLTSEGYSCATALSGEASLELLKTNKFQLVISDIMMPIMDGIEMCRILKLDVRTSHIPGLMDMS